jgi:hypothetical protein
VHLIGNIADNCFSIFRSTPPTSPISRLVFFESCDHRWIAVPDWRDWSPSLAYFRSIRNVVAPSQSRQFRRSRGERGDNRAVRCHLRCIGVPNRPSRRVLRIWLLSHEPSPYPHSATRPSRFGIIRLRDSLCLRFGSTESAGMKKSIYSQQYQVLLDWLIEARKNADLTQQQVADKLGRPQSFVAKYEGGERRLDVVELVEIAQILGADPHEAVRIIAPSS